MERQYIDGGMSGYLHHPKRGPQHTTEAYEAGYGDGLNRLSDHFNPWQHAA